MKNLIINCFSIVMYDLLKMLFIGESILKVKVEFLFIDVIVCYIIKLVRFNVIFIIYYVYVLCLIIMK